MNGTLNGAAAPARSSAAAIADNVCPACNKLHPGTADGALRRLARTPQRLKRIVKGLDAKGFAATYGPGKWNVREILCHLRDCELMFGVRWRLMLSEEQPTLHSFDQDHWASGARYAKQDGAAALATLVLLRSGNLEMVKLAGREALVRIGMHADYGAISIGQMARHLLAHDENHLAQLETARGNWLAARKRRRVAR